MDYNAFKGEEEWVRLLERRHHL